MSRIKIFILIVSCLCFNVIVTAQNKYDDYTISGKVLDAKTKEPLPFSIISTANNKNWTTADKNAYFTLTHISEGENTLHINLVGYVPRTLKFIVKKNISDLRIQLEPVSLELDEVTITAEAVSKKTRSSSSYNIDRTALDHLQATNITDVMALLPGGKFRGDLNLTNSDANFQVRGGKGEMNDVSFTTAVEVDGVRMDNNANFGKLRGFDNRSIPVTNVQSVEVVTGIPSVEYGDLNSGMVKIHTTKGKTPFVAEFVSNPNTKMYSLRKGFIVGNGTLNASLERAQSISNIISPYTTYDRNGLTLNYNQKLNKRSNKPLILNVGLSGNIGGYNSKNDPDLLLDSYDKVRDNSVRGNIGLRWAPNGKVISNLEWTASGSYTDKLITENELISRHSSDVAIHTTENGYYVAQDYKSHPDADVILLDPGHWYQLGFYDDKPVHFNTKIKADSKIDLSSRIFNHILLGAEYTYSHNLGRGEFYDDMALAPTWREYLLYEKPAMNNLALFLEENMNVKVGKESHLKMTAGLRSDMTFINGSEYGTVTSLSPRFNFQYIVWENKKQVVSDLDFHIGWGKAVKLPSFNILFPRAHYMDFQTFSTATNAENKNFSAYKTVINQAQYNKDLRWQSNHQFEVGAKAKIAGFDISLIFFRNVVLDTYTNQYRYKPFSYNYTGPSALEGLAIPSKDRLYDVDKETGVITVTDKNEVHPKQELKYITYNRFISENSYINGSPVDRMGIEYYVEFPKIKFLNSQIRIDGNYYRYKGLDLTMTQNNPGMYTSGSDGKPYRYMGHYIGPANASNGDITKEVNMNVMWTTHIPKIRLIVSLRLESTLMNYSQTISWKKGGPRSFALADPSDYISDDTDIYQGDKFIVTYPEYYTTWEEPDVPIPFMEKFLWAKENDRNLYNDLARLVEKSNYSYIFNPRTISPYYSMNLNITKEIGNYASVSFYSTNFLNNMQKIHSNWDDIKESSIYGTGYIPRFYYGLSIRLKF